MNIAVYRSLEEAEPFLRALAALAAPWTFDIETYDAVEFPSRKQVSVDPHHPDFRVRGVAVAVGPDRGAWIDLVSDEALRGASGRRVTPGLRALRDAFASDAEKGAFNGGFDENGMVYSGWVPAVRNRTRDGMLSMVALGDGTHKNLRLESAIVVLLRREYQWDVDKGQMRDLPLAVVAEGAVRDACYTHELCDLLDSMADRDEHVEWSKLGHRGYDEAESAQEYGEAEDLLGEGPGSPGIAGEPAAEVDEFLA